MRAGFWGERQEVNADATLQHIEYWQEREGWLANFDLAAAGADMSGRRGREFSDSEIYKLLEAMSWELGRRHDDELQARYEKVVARVAAAQESDGYIGTRFGRPGQPPRYSDLEWGHELYCQGHLLQAAVARVRTGHCDDLLVEVARRSADHICATFGEGGLRAICGHAEVEVALVEFGRALAEPAYVEMARLFVERHGDGSLADIEFGRSYYQDDQRVRDADVFRGHAVRANYLAAGAVDVAVETRDRDLLEAIVRQWEATQARRTYVTGGQGSQHQDEGFGADFALPPDRAYSETCAAVASTMLSWRLLLATGDHRYADAMERALFNVVATSPSEDGRSFYYANTLHQRTPGLPADPTRASARAQSSLRAPWFDVSCCPPNVARIFASLGAYMATVTPSAIQLHQYASMRVETVLHGESLVLDVITNYPDEGKIRVRVIEAPKTEWVLEMRVPAWARHAVVIDGAGLAREVGPGMVAIHGLGAGEVATLVLDMGARFIVADPRVDAVRGAVAVERGPEVWCLESVDLPSGEDSADVADVVVDRAVAPQYRDGRVWVRATLNARAADQSSPYGESFPPRPTQTTDVALIPYHQWARRGPSTMRVWIPWLDSV